MARWRQRERIEYPAWVRCFVPGEWRDDEADARHLTGVPSPGLAAELRDWHAESRWAQARADWFMEHPEAAVQEAEDLVECLSMPRWC
jgi:hypothetical protein